MNGEKSLLIEAFKSPGSVQVRSASRSGEVKISSVAGVVKHDVSGKTMVKVTTEQGAGVSVTEDHSLFEKKEGTLIEVRPCDFTLNQEIVVKGVEGVSSFRVKSVEIMEGVKEAYDLEVPGDQNFFLSSGILAHNTYSIGGVSLDLEKSSKYQAMADGFDQQYEQMRTGVKASIKITKGLSQQRWGIGIHSALGPLSKPGVLSRRNFVG